MAVSPSSTSQKLDKILGLPLRGRRSDARGQRIGAGVLNRHRQAPLAQRMAHARDQLLIGRHKRRRLAFRFEGFAQHKRNRRGLLLDRLGLDQREAGRGTADLRPADFSEARPLKVCGGRPQRLAQECHAPEVFGRNGGSEVADAVAPHAKASCRSW